MTKYYIDEFEAMTEDQARAKAIEVLQIKGYNSYIINDDIYGLSLLIYYNNRQIKNYLQIHIYNSKELTTAEIISRLKSQAAADYDGIYSFEELDKNIITSYNQYLGKKSFITNLLGNGFEHMSIFFIGTDKEREERTKELEQYPYYCGLSFRHYKEIKPVELIKKYYLINEKAFQDWKKNSENKKQAILHELYNYEYFYSFDSEAIYNTAAVTGATVEEVRAVAAAETRRKNEQNDWD